MTSTASTVRIDLADLRIDCRQTDASSKRFVKHVCLTATHPQLGLVGKLYAYKIERIYTLKGHFFEVLDNKSDELADFATRVIDNDMNVVPKLINDDYHKGTGCWGEELNEGRIVYIRSVTVDAQVTRSHEESRDRSPPIVDFFRKLGFRRVGRTTYFAYSPKASHPSRSLPASKDLDVDFFKFTDSLNRDGFMRKYPLHASMDPQFPHLPSSAEVVAAIHAAYTQDPTSIHAQDHRGYTPIFLAAIKGYVSAVETLLSLADCRADILSRDNVEDSRNAIEAHDERIRFVVKLAERVTPSPTGFSQENLKMQYLLRKATGEEVSTLEKYAEQRRYGCTCGQCRGGWLSPRMARMLHDEGECTFDLGTTTALFTFQLCPSTNPLFTSMLSGVDCIPPALRARQLNHKFYKGFLGVCRAIAAVIERGALPSPALVAQEAATNTANWWDVRDVEHYFEKGGKPEYAINHIVDWTKDQVEDGSLMELMTGNATWEALPRCENDARFGFVMVKMGLDATQRWAPYEDGDDDGRPFGGMPGMPMGFYADSDSSAEEDD
ncbi:hypothetical protein HDZ31DRAFT_38470 [Schizophyllum fasciatum]